MLTEFCKRLINVVTDGGQLDSVRIVKEESPKAPDVQ